MIPVRIVVVSGARCTDGPAFWRELQRKSDRLIESADRVANVVTVDIKDVAGQPNILWGEFRINRADGEGMSSNRSVEADSCEKVISAISWMTALALDPSTVAPPAPEREIPAPAPQRTESPIRKRTGDTPGALTFGLGISGRGHGDLILGGSIYGDMASARDSILAPSLRVHAGVETFSADSRSGSNARLLWYVGRIDGCPFRVGNNRWGIRACATIEVGALSATGEGLPKATARTRPWVAPGVSIRAYWQTGNLLLEPEFFTQFPLMRDEFVFNPSVSLYQAGNVQAGAAFSAGWRFP